MIHVLIHLRINIKKANILEFHIKRVPEGKGSNYMCDFKPGDTVTGSGPYGNMLLRNRDRDLILVAVG